MSGKTFVVTRALGDEAEVREALQERGHHVIHAPATEIIFDHTQRSLLGKVMEPEPDAIIITSAHGAQALAASTEIRDVPLLCVGARTVHTAENLGFTRALFGGEDVDALITDISGGYDEESRFVYASALHVRHDLEEALATFGMRCDRVAIYHAAPLEALPETLVAQMERGRVDGFTFFSARAAEITCQLLEQAGALDFLPQCEAYVMSEAIAESLSGMWGTVHVSEQPTLASVLECIDNQSL